MKKLITDDDRINLWCEIALPTDVVNLATVGRYAVRIEVLVLKRLRERMDEITGIHESREAGE